MHGGQSPEVARLSVDDMANNAHITSEAIYDMLKYFSKNHYKVRDNTLIEKIEQWCVQLFGRDYSYIIVNNTNGELCDNYPSQIVILEYEKDSSLILPNKDSEFQRFYDANKLRDAFAKSRIARCRARFPIPVILYEGRAICRSSTLSGGAELYGRSGYDLLFSGREASSRDDEEETISEKEGQLYDRYRKQDIKLLKTFAVGNICDLMVEKKKVKFGLSVTSSEKVDKIGRYSEFTLINLPYPGCEFFSIFKDCEYNAEGLVFNWNQPHIDADIVVPKDHISSQLGIDWNQYKSWDLVRLTQNYFQLILRYVTEGTAGILIHCISGWDRTPLFISLLRISLWADGKIHKSLTAKEILYLTLAYDWFLCGHNLIDRINRGEEILYFCFYFLKYIASREFSSLKRSRSSENHSNKVKPNEGIIDSILLDSDRRSSICGSNTSLSSTCSSVSYKSHETPPVVFTNMEDGFEENSHSSLGNGHVRLSPSFCTDVTTSEVSSRSTYSSTTPVAVPGKVRWRSDSSSSASCGSWQIVTGTGSVRGTANSEAWQASSTDASSLSRLSQSSLGDIQENENSLTSLSTDTVVHCSRRERLHAVRSAFYSQYCAAVGIHGKSEGSKLSNFFDHFAEKVGIRTSQGTSRPT